MIHSRGSFSVSGGHGTISSLSPSLSSRTRQSHQNEPIKRVTVLRAASERLRFLPSCSLASQRSISNAIRAPSRSTTLTDYWGSKLISKTTSSIRGSARGLVVRATLSRSRNGHVVVHAALAERMEVNEVETLLKQPVSREKDLVVGELSNGFKYVILPNKLPPGRFEAHLEVHAGSVDEGLEEQGIAHLVEHVTFLGSKKRENLLGTGARANAYTDFHHTVFHVHAPISNNGTGSKMLPQVLDALEEIAFKPEFLNTRIEKERKAVLAEAQMMNTIEYRVDCQLLQYLHEENNLGFRFPIGKTEQVKKWPVEALKAFWGRWYFPANATLYIVGDLDRDVKSVESLIEGAFGKVPAGKASGPDSEAAIKKRHEIRPPVVHKFGHGPLAENEGPASVNIFRHPLLHHFMLSLFCKLPLLPMTRLEHLRQSFMMRILLSVFQTRIHGRYMEGAPDFISIELDISDSGREGCAVSTLTITSEPKDWKAALTAGVQESRRLQRHGLTHGEFERYREAILRDSSQLAEQANKIPSLDTLNFVMESLACGHTVMGHRDAHESMVEAAATITLEDMNALARSMLSFSSDYGSEQVLLDQYAEEPQHFMHLGPTRATSAVVCIPAYVDATGASVSGGGGGPKRASLGADGHIDADSIDLAALEEETKALDEFTVPEGAIKFDLTPAEIQQVLSRQDLDVTAIEDIETPDHLMTEEDVEELVKLRSPRFVPLIGELEASYLPPSSPLLSPTPPTDPFSSITQRRLSNGIRVNYKHSDNEPKACMMRICVNGGRAAEKLGAGPDGFGAVVVGARALSEVGCVGDWPREQMEAFCVCNLINCALEADEENIVMDFHFATGENGVQLVFELAHLFLEKPRWKETAMDRAKQAFLSQGRSLLKSLERATSDRIMTAMLGTNEQRVFREPTAEEIEALTLEGMQRAVSRLIHTENMEINIVGDFDPAELERCLLRYIGTVSPRPVEDRELIRHFTSAILSPPFEKRHTVWHLTDSDERASAYVAGPAPCRWGATGSTEPLSLPPLDAPPVQAPPVFLPPNASAEDKKRAMDLRRNHPLYQSVTLMLLTEIINSRLFTTVRDTLGLTYDVSFEVTMFDRLRTGWYSVHVTSDPEKIYDALNASVAVLRDIAISPVNRRELSRARTTLLTRHESDMKDNTYWLGLITHMQNDHVPFKSVLCLRDLKVMYEAATVEDVYHMYNQFDFGDKNIFTCIGISGKEAPVVPENYLMSGFSIDEDDVEASVQSSPQPSQQQQLPNPMSLMAALMAAAKAGDIKKGLDDMKKS